MAKTDAGDRNDHIVSARSPGAPYETAARAGSARTPSNMEKMARYTATRPQIQSDFMKQSRGRVPPATRAHFYDRRYPRDSSCGCTICNLCEKGRPCEQCNGRCVVCLGVVPPGPSDVNDVDAWGASIRRQRA